MDKDEIVEKKERSALGSAIEVAKDKLSQLPLTAPLVNAYDAFFNESFYEDMKNEIENGEPLLNNRLAMRVKEERIKDVMNLKKAVQNSEFGIDFQAWKFGDDDIEAFIERKAEIRKQRSEEIEDLTNLHDVMKHTVNLVGREAGFFNKYISQPISDVLVDIADITDLGDMVSGARVGTFVYGAGIGDAVGATATVGKLGSAGKLIATQGAIGMVEGAVDYARYASEDVEQTPADYAKYALINTGANLASYGLGKLVGKSFDSIMNYKKTKIDTKLAKATTGTVAPTPSGIKGIDVIEESLDNATGGNGAKILAVNGAKNGAIEIDPFATGESVLKESMQIDVPNTTVTERQAIKEAVENYKIKNGIKATTQAENFKIANIPEVLTESQDILKKSKNKALEKTQMALYNQARFKATVVQNIVEEAGIKDPNILAKYSGVGDEQTKLVLDTVKLGYEQASEKVSEQLGASISAKGSAIGINDIGDFFQFSQANDIDVMKSFYNRGIGKDMPKEYQEVFGIIQGLYDKYVVKVAPAQLISETDEIFMIAKQAGIEDKIFEVYDYIPKDWVGDSLPHRIKQGLKPDDLSFFFGTKIEEPLSQVDNLVRTYSAKKYNHALDDKAIEILKESTGKNKKQIVSELKEAGLRHTDADYLYKFMKKMNTLDNEMSAEGIEIVNAIKKEYRQLNTRENRVWNYFNKREVLKYEDLISTRVDADGNPLSDRVVQTLEEARKRWTPEQAEEYGKVIEQVEKRFGKIDPVLEKSYNGIEIKGGKDVTKIVDTRTTTVKEYYDSLNGKGSWDSLNGEQKIKELNGKIGNRITRNEVSKVGSTIIEKNGSDDLQYIATNYLDKWNVSDKVRLVINESADNFDSHVATKVVGNDKAYDLVLNLPEGLTKNEKAGILRHELQHIYESEFSGKTQDVEWLNNIFRNEPSIRDEGFIAKILDNKPVSLREVSGKFYNDHFYVPSNDSFETSYLGFQMREHYNRLTTDEKFLHFLKLVDDSRLAVKKGRSSAKEVFGFGSNQTGVPEFLSEVIDEMVEVPEDFIFKSFKSENDMVEFLSFLTRERGSEANNVFTAYSKISTAMRNETVGYSPTQLLKSLNTDEVSKSLISKGIDTRNISTDTGAIINHMRETLRSGLVSRSTQSVDEFTNYEMFKTSISSAIIGNRYYKDAIVANVNNSLGKIYNGDIKGGILGIFKETPNAYKYMSKSLVYQTGNILDQTNIILQHVTNDLMGINYEGRMIAHMADTLQRLGNIGTENVNLKQISNFVETQTKINLIKSGIPLNSTKGRIAMIQAKQLHGLKTDDMVGGIMAMGNAKSYLLGMLDKNSFNELSPIQKKMYHFSGIPQENFALWKNRLKDAMEIIKLDDIPSSYSDIRNVLNAGISESDIIGLARRSVKGEYSPFMYMVQTTFNIAGSAFRKVTTNADKGVYLNRAGLKESMPKMLGTALAGATGLLTVAPTAILYQSIKNRESFLTTIESEFEEFNQDPAKYSKELSLSIIGMTPFGIVSEQKKFGHPIQTLGQLTNRRVYNFKKGEYKGVGNNLVFLGSFVVGATATKLITDFSNDKKNDGKSVSSYIQSPKFSKDLQKESAKNIQKQLPLMYQRTHQQYRRELENDKVIYDFTRGNK